MDNISSCLVNLSAVDPLFRTAEDPTFFEHSPKMQNCKAKFSGQSEWGGSLAPDIPNSQISSLESAQKTPNSKRIQAWAKVEYLLKTKNQITFGAFFATAMYLSIRAKRLLC